MRNVSTPALHTSILISINMQIREATASQQNANALHNYGIQGEQQQRDMHTRFTHVATFRLQPSALPATPATTAAASYSAGHPLPSLTAHFPGMRGMLIGATGQDNSSEVNVNVSLKERSNRILTLPVKNFLLGMLSVGFILLEDDLE